MTDDTDPLGFSELPDYALLSKRAKMREELERLPPHSADHARLSALYELSTAELDERARRMWAELRRT